MIDASDDTTGGGAPSECPMHQPSAPLTRHKLTAEEIVIPSGHETTVICHLPTGTQS